MPLAQLAAKAANWGYDGLELACWGDHLTVFRASESMSYCRGQMAILRQQGLNLFAICNAPAGQLRCDPNDDVRSDGFAPAECRGNPDLKREWGIQSMKRSAVAARNLGARVVTGLIGSPIWHLLYLFPPPVEAETEAGFRRFAAAWRPILDVFEANGVGFAMECHPTSVAYDLLTAERALEAADQHPALGFKVDFASILGILTDAGYDGLLSVEWEDSGMEREQGARESLAYLGGVTSAGR